MKTNKDYKNLLKIFVIGFILLSSIYILYFYNISTIENFITNNCSKCKISPTASQCKPIYNIEYRWDSIGNTVDIRNRDTGTVLCEWESDCSYNEMGNNILPQEQRLGLSNTQLFI